MTIRILILLFLLIANQSFAQDFTKEDSLMNPADSLVLKNMVINEVSYPKLALENRIEGTVYVEFDLDSICTILNVRILKGIGYGCDEEAIKAVKDTEGLLLRKNRAACPRKDIRIPIHFRLY